MTLLLADSDLSTPTPLHHQANATQVDTTQIEILKLLQRIQSNMSTNAQPQPPNNANTRTNTARTHAARERPQTMLPSHARKPTNTVGPMEIAVTPQ